jgi:hypothetical protein
MNNIKYKLNPYWITGFMYGERCFYIRISRSKKKNIKQDEKSMRVLK